MQFAAPRQGSKRGFNGSWVLGNTASCTKTFNISMPRRIIELPVSISGSIDAIHGGEITHTMEITDTERSSPAAA